MNLKGKLCKINNFKIAPNKYNAWRNVLFYAEETSCVLSQIQSTTMTYSRNKFIYFESNQMISAKSKNT